MKCLIPTLPKANAREGNFDKAEYEYEIVLIFRSARMKFSYVSNTCMQDSSAPEVSVLLTDEFCLVWTQQMVQDQA